MIAEEKLTPKQEAVIHFLQNGWRLITDSEIKGAWVCCHKWQFHINNGIFWRLVEKDFIHQSTDYYNDRHSFILTEKGKNIKTKKWELNNGVITRRNK